MECEYKNRPHGGGFVFYNLFYLLRQLYYLAHGDQVRVLQIGVYGNNIINSDIELFGNAGKRIAIFDGKDLICNFAGCALRDFQSLAGVQDVRL